MAILLLFDYSWAITYVLICGIIAVFRQTNVYGKIALDWRNNGVYGGFPKCTKFFSFATAEYVCLLHALLNPHELPRNQRDRAFSTTVLLLLRA